MNTVQVILFNGYWIATEIEDVDKEIDIGEPDCILKYPYLINNSELEIWPPYTNEREIAIRSDEIHVMVDSDLEIATQYINNVKQEKA